MGILGMNQVLALAVFKVLFSMNTVHGIGANWGTQSSHLLPPPIVVKLLRDNGIQKLKLFDAEASVLRALSGSGIEVMVGIPNEMLASLANSVDAAERWVEKNVSTYVSSNSVDIRYVAVGNEPFLQSSNGSFIGTTFPALKNIQAALIKAGLGSRVRVTIPLNADVYQSSTENPSTGDFRPEIRDLMVQIASFLSLNGGIFTVNIYPFISLYKDPNFPVDYAFFDGYSSPINDNGRIYTNVFDANYDTLVWALQKNGFGNLTTVVGEIGWPTDGDRNANIAFAQRFNQGFISHMNVGTPMKPGPLDVYLFSLIDEDAKSIQPGNFERHWGIFKYDGTPKYNLSLGSNNNGLIPASNVEYLSRRWCVLSSSANPQDPQLGPSVTYACENADCTSLGYGTSCSNLDAQGNASYAFNSYYQRNNQLDSACRFPNLSVVTTSDPSVGTCKFNIMIRSTNPASSGFSLEPSIGFVQVLLFLLALFEVV
ncbi:glucan endo-1,3-beta-glucosidase 6-like [Dorcoceras hygrometricum]|uniref:glucan endo-1,3-beta-D-glucosidase n=1 Tax=Dorcoceras hygrometricum TaxID=472368 RepID=A0A2Z7ADW8_9LAMI|nr:glucan endo-1,3-beta-glucosidase 6-like [Dorcoceras hygrometricum]